MKTYSVLLVGLLFLVACTASMNNSNNYGDTYTDKETNYNINTKGRLVLAITDAAANMNEVSSIKVTVDNIKVHSETEGWVTLSETSQTYDLLQLKNENKLELLTDAQLKEGTYNQVRLQISKVVVTDSEVDHEAKLPSNELKINTDLTVKDNSTSIMEFDFIADESLHVTGNGKYILAPVIQVEIKENANVEIRDNNKVEVNGGNIKSNIKVGMNVNGLIDTNLRINKNDVLSINDKGRITIGSDNAMSANSQTSANAGDNSANVDVSVY